MSTPSDITKPSTVAPMSGDLAFHFNALSNELLALRFRWKQYVTLFVSDPANIPLLNKAAGSFFSSVRDTLGEATTLGIARLFDMPRGRRISLERLKGLVGREHAKRLRELIRAARLEARFAIEWRHRWLAHRDVDLLQTDPLEPLPKAARIQAEIALEAIAQVLNFVAQAYGQEDIAYEHVHNLGEASDLLAVIRVGLAPEIERANRAGRAAFPSRGAKA